MNKWLLSILVLFDFGLAVTLVGLIIAIIG
jgi:hypothetical protein